MADAADLVRHYEIEIESILADSFTTLIHVDEETYLETRYHETLVGVSDCTIPDLADVRARAAPK